MSDCMHLLSKCCSAGLHIGTISPGVCNACQYKNKSLAEIPKPDRIGKVAMRKKGCGTCKPMIIDNQRSTNQSKQLIAR